MEWIINGFSDPVYAVAQIVGLVSLSLSIFTFLSSERNRVFVVKITTDILWAIHYLLLGELVGGAIAAVNSVRNVIFSQKGKRSWASHNIILPIFCLLTILSVFLRWSGPYSLLPVFGSLLATVGYWCGNTKNIRKFNAPAFILWMAYGVAVGSVFTVLCNLFSFTSIVIAECKEFRKARLEKKK